MATLLVVVVFVGRRIYAQSFKESRYSPYKKRSNKSKLMEKRLIKELWKEHQLTPFPKGYRGKDVSGIDFVMLDADVAGCVTSFLSRGNLNLFQTAILGLCYRDLGYVLPILNDEGKAYYWRLERLAELVLKAVAAKNKKEHDRSG